MLHLCVGRFIALKLPMSTDISIYPLTFVL